MNALDRRATCLARHKARLAADRGASRAFEGFLFPDELEQATARSQLLLLGIDVLDSLLVATAALLANVRLDAVFETAHPAPGTLYGWDHLRTLLQALARARPDLTDDDLVVLLELAPLSRWYAPEIDRAAVTVCEGFDPVIDRTRLTAVLPHLETAYARADEPGADPSGRALRPRLLALIKAASPTAPNELDLSPLAGGDGWSQHVATVLPDLVEDTALATEALAHLSTATSGTVPTKKWRKAWDALAARGDDADLVARTLVQALVDAEPIPYTPTMFGMADTIQFSYRNADLARGAIWAVGTHTDDDTAALLGKVAVAAHLENNRHGLSPSSKVTNACVTTLGSMGTPASLIELTRLRDAIKNQAVRKMITAALRDAARASGISTDRLAEGSVPDFGLDASGRKTVVIGSAVARLAVGDKGKAVIEGSPTRRRPPARSPRPTSRA